MLIVTAIVFVVLLLALVLVHEWGHFIAARKAGCRVEEFGFGFPPRLFSIQKGETRYSFNLLPIGGFVKIEGEDMGEENPVPTSFASKSAPWRIIILSAGVFMNLVLAWVLLSVQSVIGFPTVVTQENATQLTDYKTYILDVAEGSPAAEADLHSYDRIVAMAGIADPTIDDIQNLVEDRAGSTIPMEIDRQGQRITADILARANPPEGQGALGITLASTGLEKQPWWQAPWEGLKRTGQMLFAIVVEFSKILRRLFTEGTAGEALTGPIGIAIYTNEATQMGISYLLEFAALISINLAIINILPIPALDGGRILFVLLEKFVGRQRLNKIEQYAHTAGFALLIALMIFITFKDAQRYF